MCRVVHITEMTDSSSDDWFLLSQSGYNRSYLHLHTWSAITSPHTLQFTIAHALGFPVSTIRLLAMGLTTVTITHCTSSLQVFICSHNLPTAASGTTLHCRHSLHYCKRKVFSTSPHITTLLLVKY
jgi:hypothetical protein